MSSHNKNIPDFAKHYPNLALHRLGCEVVSVSDDFFGDKSRLIDAKMPVFIADKFDENGKWMDGWETRRRRSGGHDWCVLRLARAAQIIGVDIDTTHFTGNYPHAASLEGGGDDGTDNLDGVKKWHSMLPQTPLQGDSHHWLNTLSAEPVRFLRLSIYPDGGLARFRAYGRLSKINTALKNKEIDVAALLNGGRVISVSDSHFGMPENMLMPGRGGNMGDGWETRRRRQPGNDWAVIALGRAGKVKRIEIDTFHFKGNYPAAFSLNGTYAPDLNDAAAIAASMFWPQLFRQTPLNGDSEHIFNDGIANNEAVTHVRLNIYPDGGISRLRLFVS